MSATDPPPRGQTPRPRPSAASIAGNVIWRALAILAGVILLLPGLCAIGFAIAEGSDGFDSLLIVLWLICFAISFGGGALIWAAVRPRRSS